MNHLGDTNKMVSDVATKDYVDKLIEAQEVTLQALASAPITIGEDDPCDGSDESPQSLMHITVLRLDQAHKAALREVDEYRTAIMHLEERIKRLEEAGDALFELCDASPIQFELVDQIPQRLKAWEEAKEAKP